MISMSYRNAFIMALLFHVFLGFFLLKESSNPRPVLTKEEHNEPGELLAIDKPAPQAPEVVKAVSVDSKEVMETVNRLKNERAMQAKAEQMRQQRLANQAEAARKERLLEQQRLQKIKDETAKLALARKKQIEEEKKRLQQLAMQKEQEAKKLQELKDKQVQLEKIAEAKKQQEKAQAEKALAEKAKAEQAQRQLEAKKNAEAAANRAKLAGEVDKYKALIINAISQRWILPENADSRLSSQFRIRLAPDGAVLEVSLLRSSGDAILDRSAQTAIYKASPLPVPSEPATFELFRDISLTVRPENVRG